MSQVLEVSISRKVISMQCSINFLSNYDVTLSTVPLMVRADQAGKAFLGKDDSRATGKVLVDEKYFRDSILEPKKQMLPGYDGEEAGMASCQGILTETEIESVILYIKNLR